MDYKINIYETDENNVNRFALGSLSEKTLFVFGVNPSTADDKYPDQTIKKVMGFCERNGYKSFLMFNLVPVRATDPNDLPESIEDQILEKNTKTIFRILSSQSEADVLLAWGSLIYSRDYLFQCMNKIFREISKYPVKFLRIGDFLKSGQPRHPLYAGYKLKFQNIDIEDYLKRFDI